MDSAFLPVILLALVVAAGSAVDPSLRRQTPEELHAGATTYNSNRPRQQTIQDNGKHSRLSDQGRAKQDFGLRLTSSKTDSKQATTTSVSDNASDADRIPDTRNSGQATRDGDGMVMASAGRSKSKQGEDGDEDDEDKKTLSQQIAEGKYGLIEKEIFATTPKRPGIISYASNPEVPSDTAKNLGGLEPEEIWLAENHVLVLRGGVFPDYKQNTTDDSVTVWPPLDNYNAPPRQVKIPANPKVPPPFPVQLRDGGPTQFIGFNGTAGRPPFPPFFPQPPPGNGSYFAPPFPFPGLYPPIFPENLPPGGGFYPPPGNGSFSPPQFPFPLPPPRNGSYFAPPPGNFTPGSGPFYPPPFPGFPPLPYNATFYPPYPLPPPLPPPNGTLPFPPPFPNLPPGAAFLPPPGNLTEPFDEDDTSLYYPPPYDFYYPKDNSTPVPPGPLVPGIILPPPPNFFAPLNDSDEHSPPTTEPPVTDTPATPYSTYLPGKNQPPGTTSPCPPLVYLPVTNEVRQKPRPTVTFEDDAINHITSAPEIYVLTTPSPGTHKLDWHTEKPPRPPINLAPKDVQITHPGESPIEQIPQQGYYYEKPIINFTPSPETIYSNAHNNIVTPAPELSYYTVPVTDIIVQPSPRLQSAGNVSNQNVLAQSAKTHNQHAPTVQSKSPANTRNGLNTPTTEVVPPLVYYDNQHPLDSDTNTVTPSPQPYYLKTRSGITATMSPPPPLVYYTVPSVSTRNPAPVKTSFYFYEEPNVGSGHERNPSSSIGTQTPPLNYGKPTTISPGKYYDDTVSPTPQPYYYINSTGEKNITPKQYPEQYIYSDVLPVGHSVRGIAETEPQQYVYSDVLPVEHTAKNPTNTVNSQVYTDLLPAAPTVENSGQPPQYTHSGVIPVEHTEGVGQRIQPQSIVLSSVLPVGQEEIFPIRNSKLPESSSPAPPQYYYITVSPQLQYELLGSTNPSVINQGYSTQQQHVKSTLQPPPLVSKLAYFTTPRPNFSSQRPLQYTIQSSPSPRTIYQYDFQKNGYKLENQEPRQRSIYTTTHTKSRQSQRLNNQGAVVPSVQYQSTPRTLFEYSYEQSTKAPEVKQFYSARPPQYVPEDVTATSPTVSHSYKDSNEQKEQRQGYQATHRPRHSGFRHPQAQVNVYPTANPFHAYFTRQDETLLDDITKKYFTVFGQKLQTGDQNVPTTPIPPYTGGTVRSQPKRPYAVNNKRQYYTTPVPSYTEKSEQSHGNKNDNKVLVSLADDININYKNPPLHVNPFSEFIDNRQLSNSQTGGALVSYKFPDEGGHFYFITPQVVGSGQSQLSPYGYIYPLPSQEPQQSVRYRRKKRKEQR